jgi:hypothetical protein
MNGMGQGETEFLDLIAKIELDKTGLRSPGS